MQYIVVIERAAANFSAYVPDLPGCIATGTTIENVTREMQAAIQFHIDGMREEGLPIPQPSVVVKAIDIAA
jgi:predicted RNase H-like HicB family nuclease